MRVARQMGRVSCVAILSLCLLSWMKASALQASSGYPDASRLFSLLDQLSESRLKADPTSESLLLQEEHSSLSALETAGRRLADRESVIPLRIDHRSKAYIRAFLARKRDKTELMLGLAQTYLPLIDGQLSEAGLPPELRPA